MFRIELFVDDKKLAAFLNAASGLIHSMSAPQPVVNEQAINGGLKATTPASSMVEVFYGELKKRKIKNFRITEVANFLSSLGRSAASASYVTQTLQKQKLIKATGKGTYEVLR